MRGTLSRWSREEEVQPSPRGGLRQDTHPRHTPPPQGGHPRELRLNNRALETSPTRSRRRSGARRQCPRPGHGAGLVHHVEPVRPVGLEQLRGLGVLYWKLDANKYENDPELEKIRKERNYSWMDVITIGRDKLPNYEEKIKMIYKEHLHLDDKIRFILDGSGYSDVRDKEDRWIRIFMEKGDMIILPAGIYHRFTLDEKKYEKAMQLFVRDPVWTAYNQPADNFEARRQNLEFLAQTA
eukprot:bmy_22547T0